MRNVKRLGYVDAMLEGELGDLRVGQKRELALDLMREERAIRAIATIGDVMRSEDDLIGVGIPQAAHAALGGRLSVMS